VEGWGKEGWSGQGRNKLLEIVVACCQLVCFSRVTPSPQYLSSFTLISLSFFFSVLFSPTERLREYKAILTSTILFTFVTSASPILLTIHKLGSLTSCHSQYIEGLESFVASLYSMQYTKSQLQLRGRVAWYFGEGHVLYDSTMGRAYLPTCLFGLDFAWRKWWLVEGIGIATL